MSLAVPDSLLRVLSHYFVDTTRVCVIPLPEAGGFSGASLWRIESNGGPLCLRQWPRGFPTKPRLLEIHRVLRSVHHRGLVEVAAPLSTRSGETFVTDHDRFWELTPWMPGEATYHRSPSAEKLAAALQILARFHLAACDAGPVRVGSPPGLVARLEQLQTLLAGGCQRLQAAVVRGDWPALYPLARVAAEQLERCGRLAEPLLAAAHRHRVSLQPCIRDVWHDHVLFTGERVTGLIDFGALREDHVGADLSRLLGSLVGDDAASWEAGLAAYQTIRPLAPAEHELVRAYDRSAVVLSAANWLQWIYIDQRSFPERQRVEGRLASIVRRLEVIARRRVY